MTTLPIVKMRHPSDLKPDGNGIIDPATMVTVRLADGTRSTMHKAAAAALLAMDAALYAATGWHLGSVGMFRPYPVQEAGFRRSYLDHYDPDRCTLDHQRTWNGRRWYLLKNTIPKATPGRSEHGWGLANDTTFWRNGNEYSVTDARCAKPWAWLRANAGDYGYSWAYPTPGVDDPHIQYFAGDHKPPAVSAAPTTPPPTTPDVGTVPAPTVRYGSRGANVANLQRFLVRLSMYPSTGIDAIAGPRTIDGIRQLQTALGFTGTDVDGIYGPATARATAAHPLTRTPTPSN